MQESAKPHEILELEKIYNIILSEVPEVSWENNNTYALDKNKNIVALNLNENQISEIKNLASLTALQRLYLSKNLITEIKNLDSLTALQMLHLSGNQISEIKNLDSLTTLQTLYLSNNQISEIKNLDSLTTLQILSLWMNQISEIKNLESLTALLELDLWDNQITEIKNLDSLTGLQTLDLSENQISEVQGVKRLLETLNNLDSLVLYKNPFLKKIELKLENEINSNNLNDLKNYFKDIEENTKTIKSIKKIMLVGNHDSGKSTFLKHFVNNTTGKTESTHILNIMHYSHDVKDLLPEAIIYDFGGQDYYHGLYKIYDRPCYKSYILEK